MKRMKAAILLLSAAALIGAGCATTAERYATGGAAGGGVIGAIVGHNVEGVTKEEGALLGALTGALFGGLMGTNRQEQEMALRRLERLERQAGAQTVWIRNRNGSRTAVVLQQTEGGQWIGPKGEYYDHLPGPAELAPIYGI